MPLPRRNPRPEPDAGYAATGAAENCSASSADVPALASADARHELGRRGEDLAAKFLASRGFQVIERNWRPSARTLAPKNRQEGAATSTCSRAEPARIKVRGELDIIAWDGEPWQGGVLCFVEVKSRASGEWGTPGQAVDAAKQRQIVRLAQAFLALNGAGEPRLWDAPCRFDVIEVWLPQGQTPRIALHKSAFDASEATPRGF